MRDPIETFIRVIYCTDEDILLCENCYEELEIEENNPIDFEKRINDTYGDYVCDNCGRKYNHEKGIYEE